MQYDYGSFGLINAISNSMAPIGAKTYLALAYLNAQPYWLDWRTYLLINTYGCVRFRVNINNPPEVFFKFLAILSNVTKDSTGVTTYSLTGQYIYKDYKDKFSEFLRENASKDPLQIGLIGKWAKWMKPDDEFLFLPNISDDALNKCKLHLLKKNLADFEQNQKYIEEYLKEIRSNYTIKVFDEKSGSIGESDKEKRICLFCGKHGKEYFKQKAHAISESLGNKALVQNEECDECNHIFGTTFEEEAAKYFGLFRSMYLVKGKNGAPKNNDITSHENGAFCIKGTVIDQLNDSISFKVDTNDNICPQNLYKALTLYAISLIGNDNKSSLKRTIEWLNGNVDTNFLPKVSCSIQPGLWKEHPWAICYVRTTDDKSLPKIVIEFHFLFFVYVAIVPFNSEDDRAFTNEADYNHFWNSFPHFRASQGWVQYDWSSKDNQPLSYVLHFEKNPQSIDEATEKANPE